MKLKTIRENKKLSQSQLSKLTNISVRTLQHYEQGSMDIDAARLKTLMQLSIALDCAVTDLLEDQTLIDLVKNGRIK